MAVTRLIFKRGKNNSPSGGRRQKFGEVSGGHLRTSPRLSSTSCSFVDRTPELSTKHRKDTALDLKKN